MTITDISRVSVSKREEKRKTCQGGWEGHDAHLELNGECPWCGCYDGERVTPYYSES